jgi:colanic acid biosynthesis protein WcaH
MLNELIFQLKSHIPDPRKGLPEEVFEFVSSVTPMPNVDLVVMDAQKGILLAWRDDKQCGTGWHVPGGIIRFQETRADRLIKTALREYGCAVTFDPEPFAVHEIIIPVEIRGHYISFAYRCYLPEGYVIPENMRWAENLSKEDAIGKLKWHARCPEQWVYGQKPVYAGLFDGIKV